MLRLLPTFGILIFIALYIYSASIYPGGSPMEPNSVGYDWLNNLWCNLMSETAINGDKNPASQVSILAAVVLGFSMIVFFFQFAKYFVKNRIISIVIKTTGVLSMLSATLIFTKYHDIMTTVLSVCGLFGILSILRTLHLNRMTFFEVIGIGCLIVIALNNFFYYRVELNEYLPIVQLIDFVLVLGWTIALNFKMIGKKALLQSW